jgi:hypothetical protein
VLYRQPHWSEPRQFKRRGVTRFRIFCVRDAYRHRAAIGAVVPRVTGVSPLDDPQAAFDAVRGRWLSTVRKLGEAGCGMVPTWTAATYMGNCPPFSVRCGERARVCGRAFLCPFCYARQNVLDPFRRLEKLLFGVSGKYTGPDGHVLRPLDENYRVFWFRVATTGVSSGVPWSLDTVGEHAAVAYRWVRAHRKYEVNLFDCVGGYVVHHVYPSPEKARMVLNRCGVLVLPEDPNPEALEAYRAKGIECGVLPPSKQSLAEGFTSAIYYPGEMLKIDPAWLGRFIDERPRVRLTAFYGSRGGGVRRKQ